MIIVQCKQTGVCHEAIAQSDDENTGKRYYFVGGEWRDAELFTRSDCGSNPDPRRNCLNGNT